jgi:hypothetical protein
MTVGSVISDNTRPPTSDAERGSPMKLMKTARPSRPNTIEGTAARLLIFTSMMSVSRFFGRELFQVGGGRDTDRHGDQITISIMKNEPMIATPRPAVSG